jgi:hypothetical protein
VRQVGRCVFLCVTRLASASVTVNEQGKYATMHDRCHNIAFANMWNHAAQTHEQGGCAVYNFISYYQISFYIRVAGSHRMFRYVTIEYNNSVNTQHHVFGFFNWLYFGSFVSHHQL